MRNKLSILGLMLVLSSLIVSGCGTATPTEVAAEVPPEVREARDAALAYVGERYGDQASTTSLNWTEENVTPEDWVGSVIYEFTARDWVVTIYEPVLPPERVVRKVTVANETAGFRWEGKVDAAGQVFDAAEPMPVQAPDPARARDAALAYIINRYDMGGSKQVSLPELVWAEENITPGFPEKPVPGSTTLQYSAKDWVVTISYPTVRPDLVVYRVAVANQIRGFKWEGEVDAAGQVAEQPTKVPTATTDWKTYTNERYGYSLRYPPDCTFGPMPKGCKQKPPEERPPECLCFLDAEDPDQVHLEAFTGEKDDLKGAAFWVTRPAFDPPPGTDLIKYMRERYPSYEDIPNEPNVKVGGIPAVRLYTPPSPMAFSSEEIYFIKDDKLFRIYMQDVDEKTNRELYDRISFALDISMETPTIEQSVVGWYGYVVSTQAGSQFDDYLALEPEGAGAVGLTGADNTVEAQIQMLRDIDAYAHFWGTLTCPVLDYGGCELVVTRLREDRSGPSFDPDPVEGWEGIIVSFPPGSQFDDYLILAGDFPVGYGIDSLDPTLAAQLAALRDTGTAIRVWGELVCPTINAYGTGIVVSRIEIVGEPPAPSPTPPPSPTPTQVVEEPVDGWVGTIVQLLPGSQHKDYFERDDGQRYGIEGADDTVREQIEEYRWTGAQVRVWGQLHTDVPAYGGRNIQVERIEAVSGPAEEERNLTPFATTSASSHLPTDRGGQYQSWMAMDGALETSWVEGIAGPGIGEWFMLTFPGTVEIYYINLDIGCDRDADIFFANNRIKRATLIFSNGEQIEVNLSDSRGMQMIALARAPGPNIETTFVKVVIEEVFPGSRHDDTCLAEIEVWGRAQ